MNKRLTALIAAHGVYRGNAWTDVQFSNYIRPVDQTECNDRTFEPGRLREFDLQPYRRHHPFVLGMAARHQNETCVLYVWRTRYTVYGATLADEAGKILDRTIAPGCTVKAIHSIAALESAARLN